VLYDKATETTEINVLFSLQKTVLDSRHETFYYY
jgi:hypothetical protein